MGFLTRKATDPQKILRKQEIAYLQAIYNAPAFDPEIPNPGIYFDEIKNTNLEARGIVMGIGVGLIGYAAMTGIGYAIYETGTKGALIAGTVAVGGLAMALYRMREIRQNPTT